MGSSYVYKKELEELKGGEETTRQVIIDRENLPQIRGEIYEIKELGFTIRELDKNPQWLKMTFIAYGDVRGIGYFDPNMEM